MAKKVNNSAAIPSPVNLTSFAGIAAFLTQLVNTLSNEFRDHALRLNASMTNDGTEAATAPVVLKTYVKAALPDAVLYSNGMIIVSDDVGGLTPAFSDGANWRRTSDRAVIS